MTEDEPITDFVSTPGLIFALPDPEQQSVTFHAGGRNILTMKPDGTIELGVGLTVNEATKAFLDCLTNYLPCFLFALRQRAERAEAELSELRESLDVV